MYMVTFLFRFLYNVADKLMMEYCELLWERSLEAFYVNIIDVEKKKMLLMLCKMTHVEIGYLNKKSIESGNVYSSLSFSCYVTISWNKYIYLFQL
jgi:hypothetical protein